MWVKSLSLTNIRSYAKTQVLVLSKGVNLLVGANNSGKSTILLPLLNLQQGLPHVAPMDIRTGSHAAQVDLALEDAQTNPTFKAYPQLSIIFAPQQGGFVLTSPTVGQRSIIHPLPNKEPYHFIYPFLSERKVTQLGETVNTDAVETVQPTFQNLNALIDRLSNPAFRPAHSFYMKACEEILGYPITTANTAQGKRAVYTVRNTQNIPLLAMGDGVMNIVGLLVHLAIADNNLFLIEEVENDIHPQALKRLLDVIAERSQNNQFIMTTHSNIVVKRLGSLASTKTFKVTLAFEGNVPTSTVTELGISSEERRALLTDLGYELDDYDLWTAWLFLEESSAEKIIKNMLIPWFVPGLIGRLRTFSAHSLSEVPPKVRDFNDLIVFLNLEPVYRNRVWVVVDGGDEESKVVGTLRKTYPSWSEDHFRLLSNHNFEKYYPGNFQEEVTKIEAIQGHQDRRASKMQLLNSVEQWTAAFPAEARRAFESSAAEVIGVLREIDASLRVPGK